MNFGSDLVNVLIGADEAIVRYGIRKLLESETGLRIVGEACDCRETISLTHRLKPDVLVMDFAIRPSMFDVLAEVAFSGASVRAIVLIPWGERSQVQEVLTCGAYGVVFKDSVTELLSSSVRAVVAGNYWLVEKAVTSLDDALRDLNAPMIGDRRARSYGLTPREFDIIGTIVAGCSNKAVSQKFSISERTVKHHLSNIYHKLGVSNRLELAIFVINRGLENNEPRQQNASSHACVEAEYQEV
jgi:two-component system, NarL family, nitrate/nitrite response regulator NarL